MKKGFMMFSKQELKAGFYILIFLVLFVSSIPILNDELHGKLLVCEEYEQTEGKVPLSPEECEELFGVIYKDEGIWLECNYYKIENISTSKCLSYKVTDK